MVAVRCAISRGGFSSERVFRVRLADGGEYVGVGPVPYFFTDQKEPLSADQPAQRGERIPGHVAAYILGNGTQEALTVYVPSGDVLVVKAAEVSNYPSGSGVHVSVQP
jgi:hypothetical protein